MGAPTLPSILRISLLFFPIILVNAQEEPPSGNSNCPTNFQCGTSNIAGFPLYNNDMSSPECGLISVNCTQTNPEIYIGWSPSSKDIELVVNSFLTDNQSANVSSPELSDLIHSNSCDIFRYLNALYYSPKYISYTISPNLTLFDCETSSTDLTKQSQEFFDVNNYFSYSKCSGSTIYYPHQNHTFPKSKDFPSKCKLIQLPIKEGIPISENLFTLLGSNFTLGWNVSSDCMNCHSDGGQCAGSYQDYHCIKAGTAKGKSFLLWVLVTAIIGAAILLIGLLALMIKFSKNYRSKSKNDRKVENFLKNHGSLSPKRYTHSQLKKITNSFKTKLGQGGFGSVFKGQLNNGHDVAVKLLKEVKGGGEEFINEVAAISRTSHVNIVSLLGYCYEGHKRALVYEFMPNGSLEKFICFKDSKKNNLSWDVLYKIVIGIARGLEYLHRGCNTQILHLDIKPHNILLDEGFCPKISDFGLAKLYPRNESIVSLSDARGTVGYIAPEVFCRNFGRVSHKSDVYSYGMMVLEMVGGRDKPDIEADVGHTSDIYFPNWIYKHIERNEDFGLHGDTIEDANENLRKMIIVALWCIQTNPTHRPSMSKVVEMLEGSLEEMEIPPKPYLASPPRSTLHSSTTSYRSEKLFDHTKSDKYPVQSEIQATSN